MQQQLSERRGETPYARKECYTFCLVRKKRVPPGTVHGDRSTKMHQLRADTCLYLIRYYHYDTRSVSTKVPIRVYLVEISQEH